MGSGRASSDTIKELWSFSSTHLCLLPLKAWVQCRTSEHSRVQNATEEHTRCTSTCCNEQPIPANFESAAVRSAKNHIWYFERRRSDAVDAEEGGGHKPNFVSGSARWGWNAENVAACASTLPADDLTLFIQGDITGCSPGFVDIRAEVAI